MQQQGHKTEGANRTQPMRFHPFVSTSNDPREETRGVPAGLVEAIPLNKIKYNEQRDEETGFGHIGPLGGRYENYYKYDPLHRLTRAGGADQYGFEQAFELSPAGRPLSMSTNGKVKHYAYGEHTPPHAPQRIMVEDGFRHTLHDLRWDPAGNLGQVSTLAHDRGDIQSRFLFWTEDSRLHTVVDDRHHSYYAYDHTGERTLKVTGHSHQLDVNADLMHTAAGLDEFTLYPSPYLVFTNRGYTKHYYAGTERLAARIGGGFDRAILREQTDLAMTATHLFKQSRHHTNERHLNAPPAHTIRRDHLPENIYMAMTREFEAPMHLEANVVIKSNDLIRTAQNIVAGNAEPEVYFYHSDHLGSASWITDGAGIPIQHLQYLPYGEPFVNQRAAGSTYSERFRFTGKERDEETGYSYFGARYMDHELMTMWLSVDPLADKYPSISPYSYCAWNPIKLVDPDGRDIWEIDSKGNVVSHTEDKHRDAFYVVNAKGERTGDFVEFKYGTVKASTNTAEGGGTYDLYEVNGDGNGKQLFEFLANNTFVEWSQIKTGKAGSSAKNYLTTSHDEAKEAGAASLWAKSLYKETIREMNHSHPNGIPIPSGLPGSSDYGKADISFAKSVTSYCNNNNMSVPKFNVYDCNGKYIPYNASSRISDYSKTMELYGITFKNGTFYK